MTVITPTLLKEADWRLWGRDTQGAPPWVWPGVLCSAKCDQYCAGSQFQRGGQTSRTDTGSGGRIAGRRWGDDSVWSCTCTHSLLMARSGRSSMCLAHRQHHRRCRRRPRRCYV